ncbi:hypothetical protein B4916_12020 [Yersinia intermedia]|nr:hypothetical protein B4916_12020 [Yersinia intermedia]
MKLTKSIKTQKTINIIGLLSLIIFLIFINYTIIETIIDAILNIKSYTIEYMAKLIITIIFIMSLFVLTATLKILTITIKYISKG